MVRSEGNMSLKNPVTLPGIDPGTVRLVAQRLNHYATPGPPAQINYNTNYTINTNTNNKQNNHQDGQCTYIVTPWRVRVNIGAVEKQKVLHILSVSL